MTLSTALLRQDLRLPGYRTAQGAENIEVKASRFGLGVNPEVLRIVADRLAQPDGAWARYAG